MAIHPTMAQISEAEQVSERLYKQNGPQNAAEISQLKAALAPVVGETDACILSAAAGGAVIKSKQDFFDVRQSAENSCGEGGFFGRTFEDAEKALKKLNERAAFYISTMAKIKSSKSSDELTAQAGEEAEEIAAKAGKVAAVGAGAYALYLGAAALVAFIAVKAAK